MCVTFIFSNFVEMLYYYQNENKKQKNINVGKNVCQIILD